MPFYLAKKLNTKAFFTWIETKEAAKKYNLDIKLYTNKNF